MTEWNVEETEVDPRQFMRMSKIEIPQGFIVLPDPDGDPEVVMILPGKKGRRILIPMSVVDSMVQDFLKTEMYRHAMAEMRQWKKEGLWKKA